MYINGLKYACSTCIKGHRSSHCSHVDRPLFEIRKKGRPVTQCTFCRDLRKTKQVHIKCACTDKKGIDAANNNPLLIYRNNSSCSPKSLNTTTTSSPVANDIMTMDICQDKKPNVAATSPDQCTCPSTNAAMAVAATSTTSVAAPPSNAATSATFSNNVPMIKSSSASSSLNLGFNQYQQPSNNPQEGTHSLLAPLCPTVPLVKDEENLSYSWALITSPLSNQMDMSAASGLTNAASLISNATTTTAAMESSQLFSDMMMDTEDDQDTNNNTNNMHLGFIFHKPTSQRFLDGQPRVRRRRSNKQQQKPATTSATPTSANRLPVNALIDSSNLTINTLTDYSMSTPPSSAMSPHPPSSSSNSSLAAACEPMDTHFDYLTEQLEILSNSSNNANNSNGQFMGDLANAEELTAILNNVFKEDELESVSTASHRSSVSTTATAPTMNSQANPHAMPTTTRSQCGSFVPRSTCCKPSSASSGESVVITITPLSTNNNTAAKQQQADYPTTTRIVTCYCGNQCTCPGCLVHPGNFFLGNDPYAGPLIPSSNSSSCYGSDEEDLSATITASTFNNNNSNYNMPFS
ncbi:copper-fist-domain-containing protein [Mucor ambiguus]|uniref:Copper-fist-domain-containing protein n=1 Tax=Mucor ambiguus TaxID=91626 RepID=A0A0C9LYE8_9FUNG|nr:copper-fist-domain-containing protein [Mucor ambiguus]GAN11010.1 copper-fist-domain-containing protein [Mucor ambiguus]